MQIHSKSQKVYFAEIDKLIANFIWESKETKIDKTIFGEKKKKSEWLTLADFKINISIL